MSVAEIIIGSQRSTLDLESQMSCADMAIRYHVMVILTIQCRDINPFLWRVDHMSILSAFHPQAMRCI